jgi:hypothetical protein
VDEARTIAAHAANSLKIADRIRNIYIEETASPWNEKALIKRKKDHLDVKMTVWMDDYFLYGRVFRLLLYVYDVLNPHFRYQPETAPDESAEPKMRNRHNQIWTIYVDSRVEKKGIEIFYNKAVRRNIFIDAERELSWEEAGKIFEELWGKETLVYPEITDYVYNLGKLKEENAPYTQDRLEVEINKFFLEPNVRSHIEKITSPLFRNSINELLSFAAYNCRDTYVEPSHFGISLVYQKRVFMEMVPTRENTMFLTLFDATLNTYDTLTVKEETDILEVQKHIREMYGKVSEDQRF